MFSWIPNRAGAHAEELLKGFDGVLQVDDYAGYKRRAKEEREGGEPIVLAQRRAHARRKLIDARPNAGSPVAVGEGDQETVRWTVSPTNLRRITALYAIEAEIRGLSLGPPGRMPSALEAADRGAGQSPITNPV